MNRKKIYYITENQDFTEKEILETIQIACQEGIDIIQIRDKFRSDRQVLHLAKEAKEICQAHNIPLILDDRMDIALILSCGLHLGQEDIPVSLARKYLPSDAIIGATTKTLEQAKLAEKEGASYLGVGAIYPTITKVITHITEVSTLNRICENVSIPVYAIGGLNHTNLDILKNSPIDGICIVSAIAKAEDKVYSINKIKESLGKIF